MAELKIDGGELVLQLTRIEMLEAAHGQLRAPLSTMRGIEVLDDAHEPADHGFKIGERILGFSEVASIHTDSQRIFAVVHHDTPRGVRVDFEGGDYDAWIVGCADPEGVMQQIEQGR